MTVAKAVVAHPDRLHTEVLSKALLERGIAAAATACCDGDALSSWEGALAVVAAGLPPAGGRRPARRSRRPWTGCWW